MVDLTPEAKKYAEDNNIPIALQPETQEAPTSRKLTREEYLEVENAHLRLQNLMGSLAEKKREIDHLLATRAELEKDFNAMTDRLNTKYGVDLRTANISKDGTILPTPSVPAGLPNALRNFLADDLPCKVIECLW